MKQLFMILIISTVLVGCERETGTSLHCLMTTNVSYPDRVVNGKPTPESHFQREEVIRLVIEGKNYEDFGRITHPAVECWDLMDACDVSFSEYRIRWKGSEGRVTGPPGNRSPKPSEMKSIDKIFIEGSLDRITGDATISLIDKSNPDDIRFEESHGTCALSSEFKKF